jgi:beta-lactamase regulating signal transducer with metallopeptidase domain
MNALTNPFVTASAKAAAWLLVWSWQAAVLLACVWAGLKIFRVKSPALRHQVWLFALIAVAMLPILGVVVQNLPLPQPSNRALSYAVELPRIVVTNDAAPVVQSPSPTASVNPSIKRPIILGLTFVLWLAGALVFATKAAINGVRLRRLRGRARPASLADLDCDECDCEALRSGTARLALSDEIRSPILLGVASPMIVFPADIAAWTSPAERRAMLWHELAHVARRDHYVNLFQTIFRAAFFFHPLARYACWQLSVEREMACDDYVVDSGAEAEAYAESIIKVAERSIALAGAPGGVRQLALFSARQILERRIEMILNEDRVRFVPKQWRYLVFSALLIGGVVWLLIPARTTKPGFAQVPQEAFITMAPNYFRMPTLEVLSHALTAPDKTERWNASLELLRRRSAESDQAVANLYDNTDDLTIKQWIINKHAERSEMESLMRIANAEPTDERRAPALRSIKWLKHISDDERIKSWDVSAFQNQLDLLSPAPPPVGVMMVGISDGPRKFPPGDGVLVGALLRELADARILRDSTFFEKTLTKDFQQISSSGRILNKAQAIAEIMNPGYELRKIYLDGSVIADDDGHQLSTTFIVTEIRRVNGVDRETQHRYTITVTREAPDTTIKISSVKMT